MKKTIYSYRSMFFSLRVDPFLEGFIIGSQQFHFLKLAVKHSSVLMYLKRQTVMISSKIRRMATGEVKGSGGDRGKNKVLDIYVLICEHFADTTFEVMNSC